MGEHRIAIVGAGCCGTLTAVQLLRHAVRPVEVVLIESAAKPGRGVAYGTTCRQHLLNVPAARMSGLPDEPRHFLDWASRRDPAIGALDFVARPMYGEYLGELLADAARSARPGVRLDRIQDRVTSLEVSSDVVLKLATRGMLTARQCVLALGNFPPVSLPIVEQELGQDGRYVRNPWMIGGFEIQNPNDTILFIGTGLTTIDMVAQLDAAEYRGPLVAVSRHGLLPAVHADVGAAGVDVGVRVGMGVRDVVRLVRGACERHPWRRVVDGLRAESPKLWQAWSDSDRRRFLRHIRTYWEIHRHRIAPDVGASVARLVGDGQFEIVAGSLIGVKPATRSIEVLIRVRGDRGIRSISAGLVVNCTGPNCDFPQIDDPLIRSLLASGVARCDPLHLGLESTDEGAIVSVDGLPWPGLFTLGPPCKPRSWETTAVPEIRVQAEALAKRLLADVPI